MERKPRRSRQSRVKARQARTPSAGRVTSLDGDELLEVSLFVGRPGDVDLVNVLTGVEILSGAAPKVCEEILRVLCPHTEAVQQARVKNASAHMRGALHALGLPQGSD